MMENLLRGGDYVPDGFGGFVRLQDEQALLQTALFKLNCRRGALPFLPQLGSRLREIGKTRPSARNDTARLLAEEALAGMGLEVTKAKVRMISDVQADVELQLQYHGGSQTVEVRI